jgi:outer membrane protein assembly factor BamB
MMWLTKSDLRGRRWFGSAAGVAGAVLLASGGQAADWPGWRGPARNSLSPETGLNWTWPDEGPKVLWKASVGTGFSSFAVAKGRVYTLGNRDDVDTLWCLDAETGKPVWQHTYPSKLDPKAFEGGPLSTPLVDGDRVYSLGKFGQCFCLEAATGKVLWSRTFEAPPRTKADYNVWWGYAGSLAVAQEKLILAVGTAGLALNKLTGETLWDNGPGYSGYSSPVLFELGGKAVFAFTSGHEVVGAEVAGGRVLWKLPWKTTWDQNAPDVTVSGGKMLVTTGHGVGAALYDLAASPPAEVWRSKGLRSFLGTPVLWQGALYGFDDKQLCCLEWKTGEVRWTVPDLGLGTMILADSRLLVLLENGELIAATPTPEGYKTLAKAKILDGRCWSLPALAEGRLFARNAAGEVVCLDLRK